MIWDSHSELPEGAHSELSPSNYHWADYSDDKFDRVFTTRLNARKGDELHKLACDLIRNRIKLPEEPETTLSMYVNDCIGFRMRPEQKLYISPRAFGTADAISFRQQKLRISDLKTGVHTASVRQLELYAGLFCLEYKENPFDIEMVFTIYQNNERKIYDGDPDTIVKVMDAYVRRDRRLRELREEMEL